jgi:hypothetical protein
LVFNHTLAMILHLHQMYVSDQEMVDLVERADAKIVEHEWLID